MPKETQKEAAIAEVKSAYVAQPPEKKIKMEFSPTEDACLSAALVLIRESMPKYKLDNANGWLNGSSDPRTYGYNLVTSAVNEKYKDCISKGAISSR